MSSLLYWVWLASLDGVGVVTAQKLLSRFNTPENIYKANAREYREAVGASAAYLSVLCNKDVSLAESIISKCKSVNCDIIPFRDTKYPTRLRNIYDPPIVLYVRGQLPCVDSFAPIAIVGTRNCTPYGSKTAEEFGYKLAASGFVVVTGLAKGIDSAAAIGAVRAGGQIIGVIGTGTNVIYPAENKRIFEEVIRHGALVSEYPPDTTGHRAHFPARNRIISGLSLGVIVMESPKKSGALITAARALEQNRDVFALPGNVDALSCKGSNLLLREGAIPVLCAEDIITEYIDLYPDSIKFDDAALNSECKKEDNSFALEFRKSRERKIVEQNDIDKEPLLKYIDLETATSMLSGDEKTVAMTIGCTESVHIDTIVNRSGLSASQVSAALTMLEIKGMAQNVGGNCFIFQSTQD